MQICRMQEPLSTTIQGNNRPEDAAIKHRKTVLLVENSISFTGAFKCALQQARIMSAEYRYVFVLPLNSNLVEAVRAEGFAVYQLPQVEIRKKVKNLLMYLPKLFSNAKKLQRIIA